LRAWADESSILLIFDVRFRPTSVIRRQRKRTFND
jgi:hypothetical protein